MQQVHKTELSCLYTKHKIQKRKVWNDGRLVVLHSRACLHDANPVPGSNDPVLDQCDLTKDQRRVLLENRDMMLEGEKFLIEVDGVWMARSFCTLKTKSSNTQMSSLLTKKFKMPPSYMPSRSSSHQGTRSRILGKRKRPLQPGELAQMHSREAAPHRNYLTSQQKLSTSIRNECENHDGNDEANILSTRLTRENHDFPRSSFQEDVRTKQNIHENHVQHSSKPRFLQANVVSADFSGPPDYETKRIAPNNSLITLQRNEFDSDAFYGLEEEVNDEKYPKGSASRSDDAMDSGMSVSSVPDRLLLPPGPIELKVPNQNDANFLEMFGVAPVDQCALGAKQELHVSEHPEYDRMNFALPSQSSSEDES